MHRALHLKNKLSFYLIIASVFALLAVLGSGIVTQNAAAQPKEGFPAKGFISEARLRAHMKHSIRKNEHIGARTGVTIVDLATDRSIMNYQEDEAHFSASVNKNPIALLVLEELRSGNLTFDQVLTWDESDKRAGAGVYDQPDAPNQATVEDMLYDMLNHSGNTVARGFVNQALGGVHAVNDRWSAIPELEQTRLLPLGGDVFYFGYTTPRESLWVITELFAIEDDYSAFVKDAMTTNIWDFMGVRSQLGDNDHIVLTNKIGVVDTVPSDPDGNNRHDAGIILNTKTGKMYGYSFMNTSPPGFPEDDNNYEATERADQSLKEMGRYIVRFAGGKPDHKRHHHTVPLQSMRMKQL